MKKFASGILWVIDYVFGGIKPYETAQGAMKPSKTIPLSPDEKVGKLLLDEIMQGGNFGHHDEKNKGLHSDSAVGRSLSGLKRNMKFLRWGLGRNWVLLFGVYGITYGAREEDTCSFKWFQKVSSFKLEV